MQYDEKAEAAEPRFNRATTESSGKPLYNFSDRLGEFEQDWDNGASRKGLAFVEAYLEGRLNIAFVLSGTNVAAVCSSRGSRSLEFPNEARPFVEGHFDIPVSLEGGQHSRKLDRRYKSRPSYGYQKLMLVSNIECMQSTEPLISTWVRLKRLDFSDDLFAGKICFSVFHSCFKSVSVFGEGKLDAIRSFGLRPNHREDQQVKSAAQVVNGIASDESEIAGNGHLLFNEMGLLAGVRFSSCHQTQRLLSEISSDSAVKVIDMMLCPSDLELAGI